MFTLQIFNDASEKLEYNDPAIPIRVVKGDLISFEGLRARYHWHPDVEFLLPLKGHLSYQVNDREYTVEEGQAIFVNARRMHFGFSKDGSDCVYLCVVFSPALIAGNEALYQKYFEPLLNSARFDAFVFNREDPLQEQLMEKLQKLYVLYQDRAKKEPELDALALLSSLWKDLYEIYVAGHSEQAINDHRDADAIKRILGYLYENYAKKLSLNDISRAGGVSRTKCCQLFKMYFGVSPIAYLNSYRLDMSMELLRNSNYSIIEISDLCGFSNPSYFAEMFKAQKGCSPTAFRKL